MNSLQNNLQSPPIAAGASYDENSPALPEPSLSSSQEHPPLHLKKPRTHHTPRALLYPPLEIETILAWANAHYQRTGCWPSSRTGRIPESSGDNWSRVSSALEKGYRGLTGGSSIARLLAERRGHRNLKALPPLEIETILAWADAHYQREGCWPSSESGRIPESSGDTWLGVNSALEKGIRGLTGGSSIARLLAERRGRRNRKALPVLNVETILAWADAHKQCTGQWPTPHSGKVQDAPGETWMGVEMALSQGLRGLPGGSSLAQLLAGQRGLRNPMRLPPLTLAQILAWADAHHARTGKWPNDRSGKVQDAPDETWTGLQSALTNGFRGLPGGSSLPRLLAAQRGRRNRKALPTLSIETILAWADAHHARTGKWPNDRSGKVQDAPDETWSTLNDALRKGNRTLPEGSSLARLLLQERGVRHIFAHPRLSEIQIVAWAQSYQARQSRPPNIGSGAVEEAPEETWRNLDSLLRQGGRGLAGGSSLRRLLRQAHPEWFASHKPQIHVEIISERYISPQSSGE